MTWKLYHIIIEWNVVLCSHSTSETEADDAVILADPAVLFSITIQYYILVFFRFFALRAIPLSTCERCFNVSMDKRRSLSNIYENRHYKHSQKDWPLTTDDEIEEKSTTEEWVLERIWVGACQHVSRMNETVTKSNNAIILCGLKI